MLQFIVWDVSPEIFSSLPVRWYGLLFALGFLLGQYILIRIYKGEGKSEKHVEAITLYMLASTVIGARLGHCLFYDWEYYSQHPIEILYVWQGGLASHGAAFGILFGIWIYIRRNPTESYLYVLDRIVITIALAACLIRTGNLMNSEIVGKPTDASHAFLFVRSTHDYLLAPDNGLSKSIRAVSFEQNKEQDTTINGTYYAGIRMPLTVSLYGGTKNLDNFVLDLRESLDRCTDCMQHVYIPENATYDIIDVKDPNRMGIAINMYAVPRHPTQLYEALTSLALFILLMYLYSRTKGKTPEGRLLGIFIIWIFGLRFVHETFKENQVAFEDGMLDSVGVNMGQLLSIPLIVAGFYILLRTFKKKGEIS